MEQLMHEVEIEKGKGGTTVTLRRSLEGAA
jgi:hypothetical protein